MSISLKPLLAAAVSGLVLLSAAACSSTSASTAAGTGGASASGTKTVVVYSNSVSDGRGDWLKEQAKTAGFDLQVVDLGGGDVYNRLLAEKGNPVADVTFGLNSTYFEKLKKNGVLESVTPTWADQVSGQKLDADKTYWPIVNEPIMLVCNKAAYPTAADAPQDWPDLWTNPKFAGKYEVPSTLGSGTTQMVVSGILSRYRDDNGKLGVSQAGWDAIKEYFQKGSPAVQGTDLYARMKSGATNCGQMWLAGKVQREKQYGVTTDAVHPSVGVPMVTQGVAVIKGAKNAANAKAFVDWFGGAELQSGWSKKFSTAPANKAAVAGGDASAIEMTGSFKAQDIDWTFVASNIDAWIEEIQLNILK